MKYYAFSIWFQPFEHSEAILSSWTVQKKQAEGCIGATGHSLETPEVDDFSFSDVISIPCASPIILNSSW